MFGAQDGPDDAQGFAGSSFPLCCVRCKKLVANVTGIFEGTCLCLRNLSCSFVRSPSAPGEHREGLAVCIRLV